MAGLTYVSKLRNYIIDILRKGLRRRYLERLLILFVKKFPRARWLVPPVHLYQNKTYRTVIRKGVTYRLNLNDPYSHSLYFFNPTVDADQFLKIIKSHWIFIDVGANIGTSSLMAAAVTNSGRIYAYEPTPEKFEELDYNIRLNGFKNMVALKKAVGKSTHQAILLEGDRSTLFPAGIAEQGIESECVEVTKLDDEFARLKLDHVNVIRIDTQGFELNILLGAKEILEKFHPILIIRFTEKSLRNHGRMVVEVIRFVRNLGYSCMDLKTSMPLITTIKTSTTVMCYV